MLIADDVKFNVESIKQVIEKIFYDSIYKTYNMLNYALPTEKH